MPAKASKVRPSECLVCYRSAHQHHCGVPTCKGCKTFFRRMYISQGTHKCQFDMNCFDEAERESFNLRCRPCRFQKCIQVGMNPNDLRLSRAESPITLTTTSDNLPLLLKQLAHLDTHRVHLLKNCSYDGDPTIEEVSCMTQNLKFRCTPMTHNRPTLEWGFFTGLTAIDFMRKLQIVQKLEVMDRSILVRRSFTSISLLSDAHRALNNKMSYLTFQNGSDCFLSDAITVPADLENRIRCRLVGKICDLKMTYEEKLLLSVIFGCDPALLLPDWIVLYEGGPSYGILPCPSVFSNFGWAVAACWLMYIASALCFVIFFVYIAFLHSLKKHGFSLQLRKFYYTLSILSLINGALLFISYMLFAIGIDSFSRKYPKSSIGFAVYIDLISAMIYFISGPLYIVFARRFCPMPLF